MDWNMWPKFSLRHNHPNHTKSNLQLMGWSHFELLTKLKIDYTLLFQIISCTVFYALCNHVLIYCWIRATLQQLCRNFRFKYIVFADFTWIHIWSLEIKDKQLDSADIVFVYYMCIYIDQLNIFLLVLKV